MAAPGVECKITANDLSLNTISKFNGVFYLRWDQVYWSKFCLCLYHLFTISSQIFIRLCKIVMLSTCNSSQRQFWELGDRASSTTTNRTKTLSITVFNLEFNSVAIIDSELVSVVHVNGLHKLKDPFFNINISFNISISSNINIFDINSLWY